MNERDVDATSRRPVDVLPVLARRARLESTLTLRVRDHVRDRSETSIHRKRSNIQGHVYNYTSYPSMGLQ